LLRPKCLREGSLSYNSEEMRVTSAPVSNSA
jgi:hypothetical protein